MKIAILWLLIATCVVVSHAGKAPPREPPEPQCSRAVSFSVTTAQSDDNQTDNHQTDDNQTDDNQSDDNQTDDNQSGNNQSDDSQTDDNQTDTSPKLTEQQKEDVPIKKAYVTMAVTLAIAALISLVCSKIVHIYNILRRDIERYNAIRIDYERAVNVVQRRMFEEQSLAERQYVLARLEMERGMPEQD